MIRFYFFQIVPCDVTTAELATIIGERLFYKIVTHNFIMTNILQCFIAFVRSLTRIKHII